MNPIFVASPKEIFIPESDEEWLLRQVGCNPFILDAIARCSTREELVVFQRVCNMWRQSAVAEYRARATLVLIGPAIEDPPLLTIIPPENMLLAFQRFALNQYSMMNVAPFRNIMFRRLCLDRRITMMKWFVETCGEFVKSLVLEKSVIRARDLHFLFISFPNIEMIGFKEPWVEEDIQTPPLPQCPKLTKLVLEDILSAFPVSWENLTRSFPSLHTLVLVDVDESVMTDFLRAAISSSACRSLRHLEIFGSRRHVRQEVTMATANLLSSLNLSLRSFSFDVGLSTKRSTANKIINAAGNNLRVLKIYRGPFCSPYKGFPLGTNLQYIRRLEITDSVTHNLCFIRHMPGLQELTIGDSSDGVVVNTTVVQKTLGKLKSVRMPLLHTLRIGYRVSILDVRTLVRIFPLVRVLCIPLAAYEFQEVCRGWRHSLEVLDIVQGYLKEGDLLGETTIGNTFPYGIRDLKRLRSFKVETYNPSDFSDRLVYEALLKIPRLNELRICGNFTESATSKLYENVRECKVTCITRDDFVLDDWVE